MSFTGGLLYHSDIYIFLWDAEGNVLDTNARSTKDSAQFDAGHILEGLDLFRSHFSAPVLPRVYPKRRSTDVFRESIEIFICILLKLLA